ncbi:MAG: PD-(D/E)XK motif protein [Planctomycetes bacterium]|nr:PD-(D/E)XK motif protein [Planctomycetota bacterium]
MSQPFPDLVQIFDGLAPPSASVGLGRFCVQPIPGYPACAVGKDTSGNPVLLVQADNALPGIGAPLVLEHLCVIHLVNCRVQAGDQGEQQRTLSVIRCTDTDRALHEYFLRCLHPIVASLPQRPSRDQVSQAVERLVDLFRRMADTPRKTVTGLWAELFLIARAADPASLLDAWHSIPEEKFDFAIGVDRLDVKAASGGLRIHHFALEQLRPVAQVGVLIASLFAERTQGGTSLNDLVDAIRARVANPDLLIRLDSVVAQTLGQDWRAMQETRFDLQQAIQSLRFVDAAVIPSVASPSPPEVSAVHFRVDLTQHPMPFPEALVQASGLFRAAVPRSEP